MLRSKTAKQQVSGTVGSPTEVLGSSRAARKRLEYMSDASQTTGKHSWNWPSRLQNQSQHVSCFSYSWACNAGCLRWWWWLFYMGGGLLQLTGNFKNPNQLGP